MQKILLAGAAIIGAGMLASAAHAQSAASTVFPETSTPGKLDGAAPNSVTVNIGFQQLTAIMGEWGSGASGPNSRAFPQLLTWFHIFPSMEYVSPAGVHYGIAAEIRNNNSGQGGGAGGGAGGNTLYVHSAASYVSSEGFGKFALGTPNGALDDLGVGTGDDFGDGLFFSWYGPPNAPVWAMADSYDGDTPRQKLLYETPNFAGFKAGISYQPTDAPLDHSTALTTGDPTAAGVGCAPTASAVAGLCHNAGLARNRIELAVQYNRTFGPLGVKANVGYVESGHENNAAGLQFQNVSYFNGGAVLTYDGVELEGSVSSGRFNAQGVGMSSPGGPSPAGSKGSTVYVAGIGYNKGPFGIGAVYYGMNFDDSETATAVQPGHIDVTSGVGLGASYVVGPGVTMQFDAYTYRTKLPVNSTNGSIIALASLFAF